MILQKFMIVKEKFENGKYKIKKCGKTTHRINRGI